jgi:hypothetical protein
MADAAPVVHIGENSPENFAFKMMLLMADVEKREPYGHGDHPMDREWILRTYKQCRDAVSGSLSRTNWLRRISRRALRDRVSSYFE